MIFADLVRRFAPWIMIAVLVLLIALVGPIACRKLSTERARANITSKLTSHTEKAVSTAAPRIEAVSAISARQSRGGHWGAYITANPCGWPASHTKCLIGGPPLGESQVTLPLQCFERAQQYTLGTRLATHLEEGVERRQRDFADPPIGNQVGIITATAV